MADQANAPLASTPPPTAPEGSAPSATPAPSNAPVGLALDLPGRFGPGWTVSGSDREGNIILSKPSGDGVTTLSISQQTLDRAKQLTWNRNRKPSKQKLSQRSVQFNGIRADVTSFDAHRNRYLMRVQDAEGRTVTRWVDAKTAEKLNNKDLEKGVDDFAQDFGVKTDASLAREKTKPKETSTKEKTPEKSIPTRATDAPDKGTVEKDTAAATKERAATGKEPGKGPKTEKAEKAETVAPARTQASNVAVVAEEAKDLEIPKRLEDLDPFLRDSKLVGDEKATKLLTRVKSLQAMQAAPTPDAVFTQLTKGTAVEKLTKPPAANDPLRREYNRYQDLAKQIYEAHRTRLRETEEVSIEAEEFLKDVAREGKTVDQVIKEREFDQHVERATEEAAERQAPGAETLSGVTIAGAGAGALGATPLVERAIQPSSGTPPTVAASPILPSVGALAAGLAVSIGKPTRPSIGNGSRTSQPNPSRGLSGNGSRISGKVQVNAPGAQNQSIDRSSGGSSQVSATIGTTVDLTRNIQRTVTSKGGGGSQKATIEVSVAPEAGAAPAAQPAPSGSVGSTVSFLRAQNLDRLTSPPPVGAVGKAAGIALAISAVPLGAMLGGRGGSAGSSSRPPAGVQAPISKSGSLRVSLPGIPAPQQLRVEQYVRSSTNLNQRESQLQGFEQQHAPILEEYDGLLSMEDRSPAQESRLQQIQAEHGDTVLRPRELLQNQVQAGRDNVASLKQAGAKEGFDIPALAAPFMPGATASVPQAITPTAPSAETVSSALPTPRPPGKQTGIPSAFRPAGGRPQPSGRGPGGGLRGGAGGMAKLGNVLPSRPASNPTSQYAQAQQRDRIGGGDARESSLGSEGGSGQSPIETIPQTYGAEPTQEKSERQRQAEMMATQNQLTGAPAESAIPTGSQQEMARMRQLQQQQLGDRQRQQPLAGSVQSAGSSPTGQRPNFTEQALQKYGGPTAAAALMAAKTGGVDISKEAKKQIRRVKWEMLLSIEGSPIYFLIGAGQFFGKMGLGKYMPEELKSEWWEDLLCGTLFLAICLAIFIVCMFLFALLSGFVIFIDPRQYANAALRWAGL